MTSLESSQVSVKPSSTHAEHGASQMTHKSYRPSGRPSGKSWTEPLTHFGSRLGLVRRTTLVAGALQHIIRCEPVRLTDLIETAGQVGPVPARDVHHDIELFAQRLVAAVDESVPHMEGTARRPWTRPDLRVVRVHEVRIPATPRLTELEEEVQVVLTRQRIHRPNRQWPLAVVTRQSPSEARRSRTRVPDRPRRINRRHRLCATPAATWASTAESSREVGKSSSASLPQPEANTARTKNKTSVFTGTSSPSQILVTVDQGNLSTTLKTPVTSPRAIILRRSAAAGIGRTGRRTR